MRLAQNWDDSDQSAATSKITWPKGKHKIGVHASFVNGQSPRTFEFQIAADNEMQAVCAKIQN
jgi:hypothetical protein